MATMNGLNFPKKVSLCEMSAMEGVQSEQNFVPTEAKLFVINKMVDAGFKRITVSNFAHPGFLPQFKDCEEVFRKIPYKDDVTYYGYVNNVVGMSRAIELKKAGFGPHIISVQVATTEAFNLANVGKTTEEQWKEIEGIVGMARDNGFKVAGGIAGPWHCVLTGKKVPESVTLKFVDRWMSLGVDELQHLGSSTGLGITPTQIYAYFSRILDKYPDSNFHSLHMHDGFGFGLACVVTAMQAGIVNFDCCMGGAGGHVSTMLNGIPNRGATKSPMDLYIAPNRAGILTTEDLVPMLNHMGIETGVDEDKILNLGRWWEKILGRKLWSFCLKTIVGERWENESLWRYAEE